jgi:hypothetical protein
MGDFRTMIYWVAETVVVIDADHDALRIAVSIGWLDCQSVHVDVSTDIRARTYWVVEHGERSRPLTDARDFRVVLDRVRRLRRDLGRMP